MFHFISVRWGLGFLLLLVVFFFFPQAKSSLTFLLLLIVWGIAQARQSPQIFIEEFLLFLD